MSNPRKTLGALGAGVGGQQKFSRGGWQLAANSWIQGAGADWLLLPTHASCSSPSSMASFSRCHGVHSIPLSPGSKGGVYGTTGCPAHMLRLVLRAPYLPEGNEVLACGFQRGEFTTQVNAPCFLH